MRRSRSAEERFRSLYADHYDDVLRFARRRTDPSQADDVVAETFLVVWRRLDDVPTRPGEALPWLYAVARHCLLNAARSAVRQHAVAVRLADVDDRHPGLTEDSAEDRLALADAWRGLTPEEQEVLSLAVWEDLPSPAAGKVLGISAAAYRVRLSRARRTLARRLDPDAETPTRPSSAHHSPLSSPLTSPLASPVPSSLPQSLRAPAAANPQEHPR